jgi:poly(3-hydroxybutyrate) depolymerase
MRTTPALPRLLFSVGGSAILVCAAAACGDSSPAARSGAQRLASELPFAVIPFAPPTPAGDARLQREMAHLPLTRLARVAYTSRDGRARVAYVLAPRARPNGPVPLVIAPHGRGGGPKHACAAWGDLPGYAHFAVVCPQGQGRVYKAYSWGYPGQVDDLARMRTIVTHALPWLRVDPKRVYAVGASMGGQETLLLIGRHPALLAGAVAIDPVANLATRYVPFAALGGGRTLQRMLRTEVGGTPAQVPRAYRVRSPLTYVRTIAESPTRLAVWWSTRDATVRNQRTLQAGPFLRLLAASHPDVGASQRVGSWPHGWPYQRALYEAAVFLRLLAPKDLPPPPGVVIQAPAASASAPAVAGVGGSAGVPGALPAGFHYRYGDSYQGWPVAPVHAQHPIRGSFLDPRGPDNDGLAGYHFGVDVNVDDRHPERGAPRGMSHRVYAVESGRVHIERLPRTPCGSRRLEIGHFAYWHTSTTVREGQRIRAGQQIGWTCLGQWHVHVSEWQRIRGQLVWVNPLHAGGRLRPSSDRLPPVVRTLRFVSRPSGTWRPTNRLSQPDKARPLLADHLHGQVELRALIDDPQSYRGFLGQIPSAPAELHPYRVAVSVVDANSGSTVLHRVAFQADQLPTTPYLLHFAPGSRQNASMGECLGPPRSHDCDGRYWFRPFSGFTPRYWDTRQGRNGSYRVTVRAWDIAGNVGSRTVRVRVVN